MTGTHANAMAILRAAHWRRLGVRSWSQGGCTLSSASNHHQGWNAFTWTEPDRKCTVDLDRHRCIAKAQAKRIIANAD